MMVMFVSVFSVLFFQWIGCSIGVLFLFVCQLCGRFGLIDSVVVMLIIVILLFIICLVIVWCWMLFVIISGICVMVVMLCVNLRKYVLCVSVCLLCVLFCIVGILQLLFDSLMRLMLSGFSSLIICFVLFVLKLLCWKLVEFSFIVMMKVGDIVVCIVFMILSSRCV